MSVVDVLYQITLIVRMKDFLMIGNVVRFWCIVFAILVSGSMLRGEDASPEETAWLAGK